MRNIQHVHVGVILRSVKVRHRSSVEQEWWQRAVQSVIPAKLYIQHYNRSLTCCIKALVAVTIPSLAMHRIHSLPYTLTQLTLASANRVSADIISLASSLPNLEVLPDSCRSDVVHPLVCASPTLYTQRAH